MKKWIIAVAATTISVCCFAQGNDVRTWTGKQVDAWFAKSGWQTRLKGQPDPKTDRRQFIEQSLRNPAAWSAALEFLAGHDLDTLALGSYPLTDDGTYAVVQEYVTRDTSVYEVHRKYIDLQYVIGGQEDMWIVPLDSLTECTRPFDAQKDVANYASGGGKSVRRADVKHIQFLFPSEGHMPCIRVGEKSHVRKVVVKIPYRE